MGWINIAHRPWYQYKRLWIGVGLASLLFMLSLPYVSRAYHAWSVGRHIRRAQEALTRGEFNQAVLDDRVALAFDARNLDALETMAKILEAAGSPASLDFRRQIDAIKPGDAENLLGLAEDHLKVGDVNAADAMLSAMAPTDRTTARYHSIASGLALRKHDVAAAEDHLREAIRLEPKDDRYRLRFAVLQLDSTRPETREAALAVLRALSEKSAQRLGSLRVLLEYAHQQGDSTEAIRLAEKLASDPQATFGDRLSRLSTLRDVKTTEYGSFSAIDARQQFYALLSQTQEAAANNPAELAELINWMNERNLSFAVTEWADRISPQIAGRMPVCASLAEAYARVSAWTTLRGKVDKGSWQQADFLRLAYLAYALERLNDAAGAKQAWTKACTAAQASTASLDTLAKRAAQWNWDERAEEVIEKLAEREDCPRWALDRLAASALQNGETAQLYQVAKSILRAEPKSLSARAKYINLCLLTGQETKTAWPLAEALAKEHPENVTVATIQGLALLQQGRPGEAAALLEKFPAEDLHAPRVALYYGAFLGAAGRPDDAVPYLELGATAPQLPEEKALAEYLCLACEARAAAQKSDLKTADDSWDKAVAATRFHPEELEALARLAQQWGWQQKLDRPVLELASQGICPPWAARLLWPAALAGGDSAQIYNAAKLIHEQDVKNVPAAADFVFASLLMRHETEDPRRLAETLHRENPADPAAAAALGLSQAQQGQAEDAVALMKSLGAAQLETPIASLYYGIFLAVAGQEDHLPPSWPGAPRVLRLPEEKALVAWIQQAVRARALQKSGNLPGSDTAWNEAFTGVKTRPDWLEMLGRMALNWGWSERAEQSFWALAGSEHCPKWVVDYLTSAAERAGDSAKLYQTSKLLSAGDPKNLQARSRFVYLALLTGHENDFPDQLAGALHNEYPADAGATTSYALSLYRRGKIDEALVSMSRLKPEQLKGPRAALYYGIFLTAAGQSAKAEEFLETGAPAATLPEEKALLASAKPAPRLGATP